jgi:hypothetical protein
LKVNGQPLFKSVQTALDYETVIDRGVVSQDSAFVVPMGETALSDERTTGKFSQQFSYAFGVMISVRSYNDYLGKDINERLERIILETRKKILGWEPTPEHNEIEFIQGQLITFDKGGVFWLESYQTDYLFEQE